MKKTKHKLKVLKKFLVLIVCCLGYCLQINAQCTDEVSMGASVTKSTTGFNTAANYLQYYLLVEDGTTNILAANTNGVFNTTTLSIDTDYTVHALNFDATFPPNPLTTSPSPTQLISTSITDIGTTTGCFDDAATTGLIDDKDCFRVVAPTPCTPMDVCEGTSISRTSTGSTAGNLQWYLFVQDGMTSSVQANTNGIFTTTGLSGVYNIYALNFDPSNPPSPLNAAPFTSGTVVDGDISNMIGLDLSTLIGGCYNTDFLMDGVCYNIENLAVAGSQASALNICESSTTLITLANELTGEDTGGTWTADAGNPAGGTFDAVAGTFDPTGVSVGTYSFDYSFAAGTICPLVSTTVMIVVEDQSLAGSQASALNICESSTTLITLANELTGEDTGGTWTAGAGNPAGGTFDAVAGTFDPTGVSVGTYSFDYSFAAGTSCTAAMSTVMIEVEDEMMAGSQASALSVCEGSTTLITLTDELTGEDAGGTWTADVGNPAGGTFDAAGTFNPTGALMGSSYSFTYAFAAGTSCVASMSTVTITINDCSCTPMDVCEGTSISRTSTGSTAGNLQWYLFVQDGMTSSVQANTNGIFTTTGLSGVYNIYALNFDPSNPPSPLNAAPFTSGTVVDGDISNMIGLDLSTLIGGCYNTNFLMDGVCYNVLARPAAPTIAANGPYCLNDASPVQLSTSADNGGMLTWYEGATFAAATNLGATAPTPSTATAGTTTYWVTETDVNSCVSDAGTLVVTVNSLPSAATISSNGPICSGADAVFTITGAAGDVVTYTGAASGTTIISAGGTIDVTVSGVSSNTTLNLTNVNDGTCDLPLTVVTSTVAVEAIPTIVLGTTSCNGDGTFDQSITITGLTSGTYNVLINGASPTTLNAANPTSVTEGVATTFMGLSGDGVATYTFMVTNAGGAMCANTNTTSAVACCLADVGTLSPSAVGLTTTSCEGSVTSLSVDEAWMGAVTTAPYVQTYLLVNSSNVVVAMSSDGSTFTPIPVAGNYSVYAFNENTSTPAVPTATVGINVNTIGSTSGCFDLSNTTDADILNVTINADPIVTGLTASAMDVCIGASSTVSLTSNLIDGTYTLTYDLSAPNAVTGLTTTVTTIGGAGNFTVSSANLSNTGETTITITGIANNATACASTGLSATTTIDVTEITIAESHIDVTCPGGDNGSIDLTVNAGGNPFTVVWSTPNGSGLVVNAEDQSGLTAGTYTVEVTNTTTTCTESLTISISDGIDSTDPSIVCPSDLTVAVNASCTIKLADYTSLATINDDCAGVGTITVMQSPTPNTTYANDGTVVTVTLTADDGTGNTVNCDFTVTLDDDTPPTITCPANQIVAVDANCAIELADYTGMVTALDNCSMGAGIALTQSPASGVTLTGDGTTQTVTITATDEDGNMASCDFMVTLDDTNVTTPTITCPTSQSVTVDMACSTMINDYTSLAVIMDNCTEMGSIVVTQSPIAGTQVTGAGTVETVTLTADDGNGNMMSCNFTVTLQDNTAPIVSICPSDQVLVADANCNGILGDYTGLVTAADNCTNTASLSIVQMPAQNTTISSTTSVTVTISDATGNMTNCTFMVTIDDATVPSIACPANVVVPVDGSCEVLLVDYTGNATVSDNCTTAGTITVAQSPADGTLLSGDGTVNVVTLTATDEDGNMATCMFNVTLDDTGATEPTITCPANAVVDLDANCEITLSDYTSLVTVMDNCTMMGSITVNQSPVATTVLSGDGTVQTVTMTADDGNGNMMSCTFTVTLNDVNNPMIVGCPLDQTLTLDANCNVTLPDYTNSITVTDNCTANPTITQAPTAAITTLSGDGATQVVTLTVDDGNGNTEVCSFTVTTDDTTGPTIVGCPSDLTLDVDGNCEVSLPDYAALITVSDNCTVPSITQSPIATTVLSGDGTTQTVTLTVDDGNGNTEVCTFTVTLDDLMPPAIICSGDLTLAVDGSCEVSLADYTGSATILDNCSANGNITVTQSPASGSTISGDGTVQTVILTAQDEAGNMATCMFNITLDDTGSTLPTINCPSNQLVDLDANCEVALSDYTFLATVMDNCTMMSGITVNQSPVATTVISGSGTVQVVTLTADDGNGNMMSCTFMVTLNDVTNPVIVGCPLDQTLILDANCNVTLPDYTNSITVSDNCTANPTITQTPTAAITTLTGDGATQVVTLTVDDGNGNTEVCSFTVTTDDTTGPTIVGCPSDLILDVDGNCEVSLSDYAALITVSDNCTASPSITQSPTAATVLSGDGTTQTVTLTVNDGNGNTEICTFMVTLEDDMMPMVTCSGDLTIAVDGTCQTTLADYTTSATISDNCSTTGNITVTQSPTAGTILVGNLTMQTVTITATDEAGNSTDCSFIITLDDSGNTGTSITCPGNQIQDLDATCSADLADYTDLAIAMDNCTQMSSILITQSPLPGTTLTAGPNGTQIVTLTADDGNGNMASCDFIVTIEDNTVPTITCPIDQTLAVSTTCEATLIDYTGLAIGLSDNCAGTVAVSQAPLAGTILTAAGTTQVITLTADDGNGNVATCMFTITLTDTTPPIANCQDITVTVDNNGIITVDAAAIAGASMDDCGSIQSITIDGAGTSIDFICDDVGVNTVTITIVDDSNNSATCTANITVDENLLACGTPEITNIDGPTIADPCFCLNNATNLIDGQFGEEVVINNSAPGVVWTITQVNGLYSFASPNPPAAPIDNLLGTTFTEDPLVPGRYTLLGKHVDAVGYSIQVQSPAYPGLVLDLTNTCYYPNPIITGIPTDAVSCGAPFTIAGSEENTIIPNSASLSITGPGGYNVTTNVVPFEFTMDPGVLTPGTYDITYTFDAGLPSASSIVGDAGAQADPGCTSEIQGTFTIGQPVEILCRPPLNILADEDNCGAVNSNLLPPIVLNSGGGNLTITNDAPSLFPIGTTVVTWIVEDMFGCIASCTQDVTVSDNTPPVIDCGNAFYAGTSWTNCGYPSYLLEGPTVSDNCGILSVTNDAPPFFEPGMYMPTWTVTDNAGNQASCMQWVTITDTTMPKLVDCPDDIVLDAQSANGAIATWSPPTAMDNCPGDIIWVSTHDSGDEFPIGTTDVVFTAYDQYGNTVECEFSVTVTPITNALVSIGGIITTEQINTVEEVEVQINSNSGMMDMEMTPEDGWYDFSMPNNGDYTIVPEKDIDPLNGVTTFDLVLINKHILNIQPLSSPYKMIAADVNKSNSITVLDIVHLQKLILFINEDFPSNTSWRFVDKSYEFPNSSNPFAEEFPEVISLNNINQENMESDFVAIKIGDTNGTATANSLLGVDDRTNGETLQLSAKNSMMKAGETYEIELTAANFNHLGFQFTLNFDKEKVKFEEIKGGLGVAQRFGLSLLNEGVIPVSWHSSTNINVDETSPIITLTLTAITDGAIAEALSINSRYTKAEAYVSSDGERQDVDLTFNGTVQTEAFKLYQNVPNPFMDRTIIGFNLPAATAGVITINDLSGKVVYQFAGDFAKGYNQIEIANEDLPLGGVWYYQLKTNTDFASGKMILIK